MSTFINFQKKLAKLWINKSYMTDKTRGSPSNTIKRQIPHILDTEPTHTTEYNNEKGLHRKI